MKTIKRFLKSIFKLHEEHDANRYELLDVLRGLTMILVVLHHSAFPYGDWILAFHMPFIFFLSGYTDFYLAKTTTVKHIIEKRAKQLLIPYFFFEFSNMLIWYIQCIVNDREANLLFAFRDIFFCLDTSAYAGLYGRLWFLPGMFFASIYFAITKKLCTDRKWMFAIYAALFLGISWCTATILPFSLPFRMDTAFYGTFFIIMGYTLGKYIPWFLSRKPMHIVIVLSLALSVMLVCIKTGAAQCFMFQNTYGNYGCTLITAICGCCVFFVFGKNLLPALNKTPLVKKIVLWYGLNSTLVYPVHPTIRFVMWFFLPPEWCQWYFIFAAMFFLTIPIVNFLTIYLPFITGKLNKQNRLKEKA